MLGAAEWLAIDHGPTLAVSAICPTLVDTPMAVESNSRSGRRLSLKHNRTCQATGLTMPSPPHDRANANCRLPTATISETSAERMSKLSA